MADYTVKMNLATWDQLPDRYDYQQLASNWQKLDFHDHSPGRGVPIPSGGIANGAIQASHLAAPLAQDLGINAAGTIGRGALFNAGPGTRTSASYGALSDAADQIANLWVNTNSLLLVAFHALWKVSSGGTAGARILLNGATVGLGGTTNTAPSDAGAGLAGQFLSPLYTSPSSGGLGSADSVSSNASDSTTGETIGGGIIPIFGLPAGQYTLSIVYSTSPGTATVTVQNRHLWAWTVNFV